MEGQRCGYYIMVEAQVCRGRETTFGSCSPVLILCSLKNKVSTGKKTDFQKGSKTGVMVIAVFQGILDDNEWFACSKKILQWSLTIY